MRLPDRRVDFHQSIGLDLIIHGHKSDSSPSGNTVFMVVPVRIYVDGAFGSHPRFSIQSSYLLFPALEAFDLCFALVRERGARSLRAIPGLDIPGSLLSESPLAFKRSFNLPPNARKPIDALGFRFRLIIIYIIYKTLLAGDSGRALALLLAAFFK